MEHQDLPGQGVTDGVQAPHGLEPTRDRHGLVRPDIVDNVRAPSRASFLAFELATAGA